MKLLFAINCFAISFLLISGLSGQYSVADTSMHKEMDEMIITATRNERHLSNITVPALLINSKTIELSGNLRLNEILQEQTGLFITAAAGSSSVGGGIFGNGIQIQGMAPDYTLIMIDGEPVTGRQGGVIDLSRFSVGNIRKIEIIKGPSSALYGNEAMGGVVNIITEQRRQKYATAGIRYGSFNTADIYASANAVRERSSLYFFGNFNTSDGYDLQKDKPEKTIDPYSNSSFQLKLTHRFTDKTRLVWNNRMSRYVQNSGFAINSAIINVEGKGITTDISTNPSLVHFFSDDLKSALRFYTSIYRYEQLLRHYETNEDYYNDDFQHIFSRIESQTDWNWADGNTAVIGGGYNIQSVETSRYRTKQQQYIGYGFVQNEWNPNEKWTIIPGLRYDIHSDYANRLSPKLSFRYKINRKHSINFSYGSGFKAPDFRQLYLYYVNPAAQGYRVYGANELSVPELEKQLEDGFIARILPEAYMIKELRPEVLHGFNVGASYNFENIPFKTDVNLFFNTVIDLINYLPVAVLKNNALIFSYMNINRALTAGAEFNFKGNINDNIEWSAGYQYLFTGDRDLINRIRNDEVYGRNSQSGPARLMSFSDYSGLLGRSPHMLNANIMYSDPGSGWAGSLRSVYRSKWGVIDLDGNGFANMPEEFARGFLMLNASIRKDITKYMTAQFNINNILNHKDPVNVPQMPGIHYLFALHFNF
jgi:outer membrane receptor for ferrienterochelin and colicins